MAAEAKRSTVEEVEVPAGALALSRLPWVDYRDGFRLELPGGGIIEFDSQARRTVFRVFLPVVPRDSIGDERNDTGS